MRQCAGSSTSPLSACSSPRSNANRLDLPEPLAPMRPMRSPGWIVRSACSRSALAPRRRVACERRITLKKRRFYLECTRADRFLPQAQEPPAAGLHQGVPDAARGDGKDVIGPSVEEFYYL